MKNTLSTLLLCSLAFTACGAESGSERMAAPVEPAASEEEWTGLLPYPRRPDEGLLSGGQPTAAQLEAIRDAGFRTVVNLRGEGEAGAKAAQVEALGMKYVALPIQGSEGLSEDNARAFAEILEQVERPAVVHCGSGNRVGALFALKAFYVDGVTVDEAFEIGERAGLTRLAGAVRQHLEAATDG